MRRASDDLVELCQLLFAGDRVDAHARALKAVMAPDSVVLDIGTGLGVFAVVACQLGARKVYAIETYEIIHVARDVAAANGCESRIEFLQGDSRRIALPERADVIVCDIRHVLPELQIPVMIDARHRLLAPGGRLIPRADHLWAAAVHAPAAYDSIVGVWDRRSLGLNTATVRCRAVNTWIKARFSGADLLSAPACWATVAYSTTESADFAGTLSVDVAARGVGHGLCAWVESDLAADVRLTNRPGQSDLWYGAAFLPWPEPVELDVGDRLAASFHIYAPGEASRWTWQTRVSTRSGGLKACFDQDTERMTKFDEAVPRQAASQPTDQDNLLIDRHVLEEMDRCTPIGVIAEQLLARFPARFLDRRQALTRAGVLSHRYG